MTIDPHWYYVFYQCAQRRSFSEAAAALYVSQPAVSQIVGKLERALGGPLFHRTARGVLLTGEGAALYAHVSRAFDSLRSGEAAVRRMMALEEGKLRIGTSDAILRYLLMPALSRMDTLYPAIALTLTNTTTPGTLALLGGHAVDVCVVHLPAPDPERYEIRPFRRLHDCLVCGGKFLRLADDPPRFGELAAYPFIMLDQGSLTRRLLDRELRRRGLDLTPDFVTGSVDSLLDMAAGGLGLAFVAREYAASRLAAGELREIPFEPPFPPRQTGVLTRPEWPPSRAERAFRSLLEEAADAGDAKPC